MDNQIDVQGWLGVPQPAEPIQQDDPKESVLVSEVTTGSYPKTNEFASQQLVSLGFILCLIVLILFLLKKMTGKGTVT